VTQKNERRVTYGTAYAFGLLLFAMTPLGHAQVAVQQGPTVPLWSVVMLVGGPIVATSIGLGVWGVRSVRDHTLAIQKLEMKINGGEEESEEVQEQIQELRRWKHDKVEQWRTTTTLTVDLLVRQMEDVHKRLSELERPDDAERRHEDRRHPTS
jgi:hypothetical protein